MEGCLYRPELQNGKSSFTACCTLLDIWRHEGSKQASQFKCHSNISTGFYAELLASLSLQLGANQANQKLRPAASLLVLLWLKADMVCSRSL